jgi:hypothetical protein
VVVEVVWCKVLFFPVSCSCTEGSLLVPIIMKDQLRTGLKLPWKCPALILKAAFVGTDPS